MQFVSISQAGGLLYLQRYEGCAKARSHAGHYEPSGVTPVNIENYRQNGAAQDRLAPTGQHRPGRRRVTRPA